MTIPTIATHVPIPLTPAQRTTVAELVRNHELASERLTYYVTAITHGAGYGAANLVRLEDDAMVIELPGTDG